MTWCSEDNATPRFVLASSAIRCRFVDRFVRLGVLSRVSRQRSSSHGTPLPSIGSGESGSPMSAVILRCYDFPARIPGHLFVSLPEPTLPASVRVSQLALALPEGRRMPSGPGSLFNRRPELPVCSHVDVSGTSQVPRRSIPCLCPALRPRPNRRSLASLAVSSMLPPRFPRRRLQRFMNFGAQSRGFGTRCLRFTNDVATTHAKLTSGWLARLYRGRESNPLDRYKRF